MQVNELRILDANFNRAREGIRVIEDIIRFSTAQTDIQTQMKAARATLGKIQGELGDELLSARNAETDMGRDKDFYSKKQLKSVLSANFKRVQESLRVLEEILKIDKAQFSVDIKNLRYEFYSMEKDILLNNLGGGK